MKIAIIGESPQVPTGFGTVNRFLCKYLTEMGHDVNMIGWQNFGSPVLCFDSGDALAVAIDGNKPDGCYRIWPMCEARWGTDCIPYYIREINPDVVLSLADIWMEGITYLARQQWLRNYKWLAYTPIDGEPIPDDWIPFLQSPREVIAMSKFGQEEFRKVGMDVKTIWHGVDTNYWRPREIKEKSGYADKFVVLTISRNQARKNMTLIMDIALHIKNNYPKHYEDILFHLHTDPNDPVGQPLQYYANQLGVADHITFTKDMKSYSAGVSLRKLITLANCCDVHLLVTSGEGFGIPTAETMAVGLPQITTGYTTTKELVEDEYPGIGPRGFSIKVDRLMIGSRLVKRAIPDIKDAAEKIILLKENEQLRKEMGANGVKFAQEYLDWEKCIIPQWLKVFGQTNDGKLILEEV